MKKKLLSIAAACVLGVQAIAMPMIANAEQGTHYVEKSDFNDVSIGGAKGTGYYGLGIIMDGSPWLSKGGTEHRYTMGDQEFLPFQQVYRQVTDLK